MMAAPGDAFFTADVQRSESSSDFPLDQFLSSVEGACSCVPAWPQEAFARTGCQTRVSGTAAMHSMARSHRLTGEHAKAG